MRFRIGIHLGDVIEKADGSVYGDGVNIAARLQALAEPGGVTVSQGVQGAVSQRVPARFDDLGEQAMKNIAEPVRVFAVREDSGVPSALRFDRCELWPDVRQLRVDGTPTTLAPQAFDLLLMLARQPGQSFTKQALMNLAGAGAPLPLRRQA